MKSFKQVAEELVPKFQRATKTDAHYTGQINGKTFVVPHAFHADGKTTPMRHAIVVSPSHVLHNNPTLTPEESARVHSHIKDIHGGQDLANLDEDRQLALHLGMTKTDKKEPSKEVPEVKKAETHYKQTHKLVPGTPEHQAERDKYRHAALFTSRKAATLAFAKKHHIIKERTITTGSLKFNKIANSKPVTYNSFGKIVKEGLVVHGRAQTYDPVAKKWKVEEKRYRVGSDNRKLALNHILKKLKKDYPHHHEHEATIEGDKTHMDFYKESAMLNEGRPIRGDVFSHHQTLIAKKTLRMPDAMLGVMGGPSKEDSRKHLKKIGWTQKQIHDHEHAQFVEEVDMLNEKNWIAGAIKRPGALHRKLGVPQDKKIPAGKLDAAAKKGGLIGKEARLAKTLKSLHERQEQVQEHSRSEKRLNPDGSYKIGTAVRVNGIPGNINFVHHSPEHPKYPHSYKVTDTSANDPYKQTRLRGNTFISHHDIEPLNERTLTTGEDAKKEEIVRSMKKKLQGFKERYGKDAKSVMYATATKQAKGLAEDAKQLDESFMGTYTRNENANRHTANIVHLAKHFGSEADKAQAKFYADELKKHGHNKHHEAQYKLHEKLWPFAVAAHHYKEEIERPGAALKTLKRLLGR
jgi:hypothetical protein